MSRGIAMVHLTPLGWRFELIRPGAHRAYVAGDFGEGPVTIQMHRQGDGRFVTRIDPPPGEYHFRYCVDGEWIADYAAFGVYKRDDGAFDSVLYVPRRAKTRHRGRRLRGGPVSRAASAFRLGVDDE